MVLMNHLKVESVSLTIRQAHRDSLSKGEHWNYLMLRQGRP